MEINSQHLQHRSGAATRASDSQLREPRFESYAAMSNLEQVFSLYTAPTSLSCVNDYLTVDSGGYLCMNSLCASYAQVCDVLGAIQ